MTTSRYDDRIVGFERVDPRSLKPHPQNPNKGDIRGVMKSMQGNGCVEPLIVQDSSNMIISGHTRWTASMNLGAVEVPIMRVDVDDDEALRLLIALNRSGELREIDPSRLAQVLDEVLMTQGGEGLEATLYTETELDDLLADLRTSQDEALGNLEGLTFEEGISPDEDPSPQDDDEALPEFSTLKSFADVPDTIFPSDNEMGIPLLLSNLQADVPDMPASLWGEFARTQRAGTVLFYVDDYKFQAVWKDPSKVSRTQAPTLAEVNFSTHESMPLATVLWRTYQKRYLARMWQSFGHRIMVDVNVDPCFWDVNLLGVPKGWRAYCTRGYAKHVEDIAEQARKCREHAGREDILFFVYGGNKEVRAVCEKHNLWWQPEKMDLATKRHSISDMLMPGRV